MNFLQHVYRLGRNIDKKIKRQQLLDFPVISVGNIAVGGRGKTPLVVEICNYLKSKNKVPVVLSRGYGRKTFRSNIWLKPEVPGAFDAGMAGDEPLEIFLRSQCAVLVGADRAKNAKDFVAQTTPKNVVFVLDDGFQHWSVKRDLDVVLVHKDDYKDTLLPAGRLRETAEESLSRAHVVLELGTDLKKHPVFKSRVEPEDHVVVLTTRVSDPEYREFFISSHSHVEFLELPDHAPVADMRRALTAFQSKIVYLGLKEAVKLLNWTQLNDFFVKGRSLLRSENGVLDARFVDFRLEIVNSQEKLWNKVDGVIGRT